MRSRYCGLPPRGLGQFARASVERNNRFSPRDGFSPVDGSRISGGAVRSRNSVFGGRSLRRFTRSLVRSRSIRSSFSINKSRLLDNVASITRATKSGPGNSNRPEAMACRGCRPALACSKSIRTRIIRRWCRSSFATLLTAMEWSVGGISIPTPRIKTGAVVGRVTLTCGSEEELEDFTQCPTPLLQRCSLEFAEEFPADRACSSAKQCFDVIPPSSVCGRVGIGLLP